MFSIVVLGNVEECRTECEISDETASVVAIVYEDPDGWHVNVSRQPSAEHVEHFNSAVNAAKEKLSHYVNRMGIDAPDGISRAELSLLLMAKDDGTALGIKINR